MNDLLKEEYNEAIQEQSEGFKIDNLETAAWAFKKISACSARIAEIKAYADNEREKLDTWENSETKLAQATIDRFKQLLADYYFAEKDKDKRFRLSTPYGSGYTRKNVPELIYPEDAPERLEKMGMTDCVRIVKEVKKKELRSKIIITDDNKAVTEDGEVLDFITIEPKPDSFIIKGGD